MHIVVRSLGAGICLLVGITCHAGEVVCLKSGFCLEADSHTQDQQNISLRMGTGSVEVPAADVSTIALTPERKAETREKTASVRKAQVDPQALLVEAADAQGVDRAFLSSVAKVESDFQVAAKSRKGAIGLMQLMPSTAKELEVDPKLPQENAYGGAKYLRALLVRYHYNSALVLAAYNAGPAAVQKFGGVPPYEETRNYILRVTREYDKQKNEASGSRKSEFQDKKPE